MDTGDAIVCADLQRLYKDWKARVSGGIPRRDDFDPVDFRYILGRMSIIEIRREPRRYFYRLHGTELGGLLGFDLTGKYLDEAPNPHWAALARQHNDAVATSGIPCVTRRFDQAAGSRQFNVEVLGLPISSDGDTLDMLITAVTYHKREQWKPNGEPHSKTMMLQS